MQMLKATALALLAGLLNLGALPPTTITDAEVELYGLDIARAQPAMQKQEQGLRLRLRIHHPEFRFYDFDPEASSIELFRDDRGNDLRAGNKQAEWARISDSNLPAIQRSFGFNTFAASFWDLNSLTFTKDRRHCLLDVGSTVVPAKVATKIELKARVVLWSVEDWRSESFDYGRLEDGPVTIAGVQISEVHSDDRRSFFEGQAKQSEGLRFKIESASSIKHVKHLRFFDEEGTELKAGPRHDYSSFTLIEGEMALLRSKIYSLADDVEPERIEITYAHGKQITIPVRVSARVPV